MTVQKRKPFPPLYNDTLSALLEEDQGLSASQLFKSYLSPTMYPRGETLSALLDSFFASSSDATCPWLILETLVLWHGPISFQEIWKGPSSTTLSSDTKRNGSKRMRLQAPQTTSSRPLLHWIALCFFDLMSESAYAQSRGEFLSAIFLKVVELDFQECQKGDKMGDSVLAQSFGDRARLKSFFKEASGWMELGEGDREVPQRALEAFGGWISLFGLLSLASETEGPIMDPGYLLTEVRSFIGTLKDEQVFSFLQTLKSIPLRTSAVDSYLEIICVYKKSDRRVIGSPLSLAKLVMHLMTSMPGNRAAFEEHARLLGYLAMQYMITNPQNTAEIQGAVKVALERLKDNITPASLLPLKLASLA